MQDLKSIRSLMLSSCFVVRRCISISKDRDRELAGKLETLMDGFADVFDHLNKKTEVRP